MDRSVDVGVAMGMIVGSVGLLSVSRCWRNLMERLGKIGRRPARGESEGEQLWFLSGVWLSWGCCLAAAIRG